MIQQRTRRGPTGETNRPREPLAVREQHAAPSAEVQRLRGLLSKLLSRKPDVGGPDERIDPSVHGLPGAGDNISEVIPAGRPIPVINCVAAGYPTDFTDLDYPPSVADEYVRCPDVHDPQAFAARVAGDSMAPKYKQGDTVIFSPNTAPGDGDDCFVRFSKDNSTTFKRFTMTAEGRIRLAPLNQKYPPEEYDREEINGLWPATMRLERLRRP